MFAVHKYTRILWVLVALSFSKLLWNTIGKKKIIMRASSHTPAGGGSREIRIVPVVSVSSCASRRRVLYVVVIMLRAFDCPPRMQGKAGVYWRRQ